MTAAPQRKLEARDPATPPPRLAALLGDENFWVRRAALANPAAPREAVQRLIRAGARHDLSGLGEPDPTLDSQTLDALARGGGFARRLAAKHPATSAEALVRLATDADAGVRRLIAAHHATPPDALAALLLDDDAETRRAAGDNRSAPPDLVAMLRRAAEGEALTQAERDRLLARPWGRLVVAGHPQTSAGQLRKLASDPDWRIRAAVARNPSTPADVVAALAGEPELAAVLAAHPAATPELLARLSSVADAAVREAVAKHPAAPPGTLAMLLEDGGSAVRLAALENPNTPRDAVRRLVAAGSTPDLLGFAPTDPDGDADPAALARGGTWARRLAARHPATPPQLLAELADDPDPLVRDIVEARRSRHAS
jgi:hypothetical protein